MSDRHQILNDKVFWSYLEFYASSWLSRLDDKVLKHFWIDGFLPEMSTNTKYGIEVEGMTWVVDGQRQAPYRFIISVPQKMLYHRRQVFSIEQIELEQTRQRLYIDIGPQRSI